MTNATNDNNNNNNTNNTNNTNNNNNVNGTNETTASNNDVIVRLPTDLALEQAAAVPFENDDDEKVVEEDRMRGITAMSIDDAGNNASDFKFSDDYYFSNISYPRMSSVTTHATGSTNNTPRMARNRHATRSNMTDATCIIHEEEENTDSKDSSDEEVNTLYEQLDSNPSGHINNTGSKHKNRRKRSSKNKNTNETGMTYNERKQSVSIELSQTSIIIANREIIKDDSSDADDQITPRSGVCATELVSDAMSNIHIPRQTTASVFDRDLCGWIVKFDV